MLANLGDENRIERHQRLVIALESGGVDRPELLMQHLEGAGDRLRAAACAEEAAKRAYSGLAFDQAAHFYEAAIRLGDHRDEVLRQLRIARAHALSMVGHGREAAQVYLAAAEGADLATRRECHRHAAEQLLITGHLEEGLAAVNALLAEIGVTLAKSPGGALASLLWTQVKLRLRGYRWQRRHIREIADSELARHDIFQVVASGLAMIDNIRGADFGARALLMALKLGEPSRIVKDLAMEAIFQSSQGGRGARRGGARLLQLRQIASDSAHPYAHAWTAGCEGAVSYFAGEFAESDRQLALAESRFSDLGEVTTFELNSVRLFRMLDHRHMGRIAAWRLLSGDYGHDAHRRGDLYAKTSMTLVGTLLLLADDRPREVYEVIEQARWRPPVGGFHVQHWYRLEAEAEVALYQRTVPR